MRGAGGGECVEDGYGYMDYWKGGVSGRMVVIYAAIMIGMN